MLRRPQQSVRVCVCQCAVGLMLIQESEKTWTKRLFAQTNIYLSIPPSINSRMDKCHFTILYWASLHCKKLADKCKVQWVVQTVFLFFFFPPPARITHLACAITPQRAKESIRWEKHNNVIIQTTVRELICFCSGVGRDPPPDHRLIPHHLPGGQRWDPLNRYHEHGLTT